MSNGMTFSLTQEQVDKAKEWMKEQRKYVGPIGGQFSYEFTPTSVGTLVSVKNGSTNESLNLTNYDLF